MRQRLRLSKTAALALGLMTQSRLLLSLSWGPAWSLELILQSQLVLLRLACQLLLGPQLAALHLGSPSPQQRQTCHALPTRGSLLQTLLQDLVLLIRAQHSKGPPVLSRPLLSRGLLTPRQQTPIQSLGRQAMPGTCDAHSRGSSGRPRSRVGRQGCTCWWPSWGRRWGRSGLSARLCGTLWPATGVPPARCSINCLTSFWVRGGVTGIPVTAGLVQGSSRAPLLVSAEPLSMFAQHAVACYQCTQAEAAQMRWLAEAGRGGAVSCAPLWAAASPQWAESMVVPPHPHALLTVTQPLPDRPLMRSAGTALQRQTCMPSCSGGTLSRAAASCPPAPAAPPARLTSTRSCLPGASGTIEAISLSQLAAISPHATPAQMGPLNVSRFPPQGAWR